MAPIKSMEESDASMRKRLVESLSSSFPGSALSRALHAMDEFGDIKEEKEDPLSRSCFAELRLEKCSLEEEEEDEELTSLAWLQDSDLLKNIQPGDDVTLCTSPIDDNLKENDDIKQENGGYAGHPPNVPYNPQKHINSKPPYSFSCLIFMAVEDSPTKKLPVKDIYHWILTHFPYFQNAPTGWKNSVRHNLSLNKCFKKVEKERGQSIGKGSLWCIDPDYRPNLLQALRKTPYHPYHQLQMLATAQPLNGGGPRPLPLMPQRINMNTPSPHLFPFLSRRLAQSKLEDSTDIDVANTLVSLKRAAQSAQHLRNGLSRGARSRSPSPPEFGSERERELLKRKHRRPRPRTPPVITQHPSEDHAYSLLHVPDEDDFPNSPDSSIDEEYEFGANDDLDDDSEVSDSSRDSEFNDSGGEEEVRSPPRRVKRRLSLSASFASPIKKRLLTARDAEEEMKIVEGADALLNLAGINTSNMIPKRTQSPTAHNNNNNNNNNNIKKEVLSQA